MSEIMVGVKDLKSRLSEYLRRVEEGNIIIITSHGKPVGRLLPVEKTLKEKLTNLINAGMGAWNGKKLQPIPFQAQNKGDIQVSDLLVDMRE